MNNSTEFRPSFQTYSDSTKNLVFGTLNSILLILAFIENLLVIVVILVKVSLKTRPINSLILSLSVADFLQSLIFMLPSVVEKLLSKWTLGSFLCKVHSVSRSVFTPVGLLIIALIGVERFRSLDKRDGVAFSVKTTRILILVVWSLCLGTALPLAFWFDVITYRGGFTRCGYIGDYAVTASIYTIVTRVMFFLVPIVMTWFCYMGVITRMMRSSRKVAQMHINTAAFIKRQQTTIRVSRTCVLIAVVFTVCWTPFNLLLLYTMLQSSSSFSLLEYVWPLAASASWINPLIYGFTWKTFRQALGQCVRCKPATENITTIQG